MLWFSGILEWFASLFLSSLMADKLEGLAQDKLQQKHELHSNLIKPGAGIYLHRED